MSDLPAGSDLAPLGPLAGPGQEAAVWPYVIGGASLMVAAQGLLGLLGGLLQTGVNSVFFRTGSGFLTLPPGWSGVEIVSMIIPALFQPLMCGFLLAAAILLLRRKRLGIRLHMVYAIVTIVLAGAAPLLAIASYAAQQRQQRHQEYAKYLLGHLIFQAIWGTTRSVIYPIFVLVWFRRVRIRRQTEEWGR